MGLRHGHSYQVTGAPRHPRSTLAQALLCSVHMHMLCFIGCFGAQNKTGSIALSCRTLLSSTQDRILIACSVVCISASFILSSRNNVWQHSCAWNLRRQPVIGSSYVPTYVAEYLQNQCCKLSVQVQLLACITCVPAWHVQRERWLGSRCASLQALPLRFASLSARALGFWLPLLLEPALGRGCSLLLTPAAAPYDASCAAPWLLLCEAPARTEIGQVADADVTI